MDRRGMGKKPGGISGVSKLPSQQVGKPSGAGAIRGDGGAPSNRQRQVFEGLVKNGVVHLIEGELPDGVLVKVLWE